MLERVRRIDRGLAARLAALLVVLLACTESQAILGCGAGSVLASPRIMSEKKIPIERTSAEFWNVVAIPAPAPRRFAGRLFMIPAWLGEANRPMPRPTRSSSPPNQT